MVGGNNRDAGSGSQYAPMLPCIGASTNSFVVTKSAVFSEKQVFWPLFVTLAYIPSATTSWHVTIDDFGSL